MPLPCPAHSLSNLPEKACLGRALGDPAHKTASSLGGQIAKRPLFWAVHSQAGPGFDGYTLVVSRLILQGGRWFYRPFPAGSVVKILLANAGNVRDAGSITGSGRSPGGGHSNPLQYSCLENHMDRGAWWATVHGVIKSQKWPKHPHMQGAFVQDTTCTDLHNSPAGAVSLSWASFLVFIYCPNVCEVSTVYPL